MLLNQTDEHQRNSWVFDFSLGADPSRNGNLLVSISVRFVLRRATGSVGLADILVVVLIADATQNAMAGEYHGVADGMVLIATIGGWNFWFDWMSYRFSWFSRFAEPRSVLLIKHGNVLRENLARHLLTLEELHTQLRQQGVDGISEVKHCCLESDGNISVIPYTKEEQQKSKHSRPPGA